MGVSLCCAPSGARTPHPEHGEGAWDVLTVAAYSRANARAKHVTYADEVYCMGDSPSKDCDLSGDRIIKVAVSTGTSQEHPGFGRCSSKGHFGSIFDRAAHSSASEQRTNTGRKSPGSLAESASPSRARPPRWRGVRQVSWHRCCPRGNQPNRQSCGRRSVARFGVWPLANSTGLTLGLTPTTQIFFPRMCVCGRSEQPTLTAAVMSSGGCVGLQHLR